MNTNKTNSSKSVKLVPVIDVLHVMLQDVMNFKKILLDDKSAEAVQQVIEELSSYPLDERLPDNVINFILELLDDNRNYSQENLCSELDILTSELEESIKSQQHTENVAFMRTVLKVMLKHADEVASWMEEEFK